MKKYFSFLAVIAVASCAFAGETTKPTEKTVRLPAVFISVIKSFDTSNMTPYQALEKVFEKGTLPDRDSLIGLKGGQCYREDNQNSELFLVGVNDQSIVSLSFLFTLKSIVRAMIIPKPVNGPSKSNLEAIFRSNIMNLKYITADSTSLVIHNAGQDTVYLRKFEKYFIARLLNSDNKCYAYAYFYYNITE